MPIDPGTMTFIQTVLLHKITDAFALAIHYANHLMYFFLLFEIVLFGLILAFESSQAWERLFLKILKIGLIFFIIQNYPFLLKVMMESWVKLGMSVSQESTLATLLANPGKIWEYGYGIGVHLLQTAAASQTIGYSLLLLILGFGILLIFAGLGIQIILTLTGFYVVAFVSLFLFPLGIFEPTARFFDSSIQNILKMGIRVMVLLMVMGIAFMVWQECHLLDLSSSAINLNESFGLLFSSLLFLCLSIFLPRWGAQSVGALSSFKGSGGTTMVSSGLSPVLTTTSPSPPLSNIQAAVSLTPAQGSVSVLTSLEASSLSSSAMSTPSSWSTDIQTKSDNLFLTLPLRPFTSHSISSKTLEKFGRYNRRKEK